VDLRRSFVILDCGWNHAARGRDIPISTSLIENKPVPKVAAADYLIIKT
jgi:hypothetical protein